MGWMADAVRSQSLALPGVGTCDPHVGKFSRHEREAPLEDVRLFLNPKVRERWRDKPFLTISNKKEYTLRAGTANPASPLLRADAPCYTEGAKKGSRSSSLQEDSSFDDETRRTERDKKGRDKPGIDNPGHDIMEEKTQDIGLINKEKDIAGIRRRELRVQLQRLEESEMERCERELSKFDDDSSGGESAGSFMSVDSTRSKRRRQHSSSDEDGRASASSRKRGRGRPPTTGQYIGLAEAKRQYVEAQRKEMELEAEREVAALTRNLRTPALSEVSDVPSPSLVQPIETASALGATISRAVDTIMEVRKKSKNLSGPMMKALGDSVAVIQEATEKLQMRTVTKETRDLEAENARLSRQLRELREDIVALRSEFAAATVKARRLEKEKSASPTPNMEEVIKRAVAEAVAVTNARMCARFEGLESRLLPAPRLRPPLAADDHAAQNTPDATPPAAQMPSPGSNSEVSTLMPPANSAKTSAPKTKKKKASPKAPPPPTTTKGSGKGAKDKEKSKGDGWQTVTNKKKKAQKKKKEGQQKKSTGQKTVPTRSGPPKLRTPTTSAVVLQLGPEAEKRGTTYADVLAKAKANIKLAEHNIPPPRFKRSATGGRLLVLPGATSGEKADILAGKIRELFGDDVLKVSRPTRCVGVRVSGLDDHSTKEDVVAAIAEAGGVPPERVRAGEVSRSADGLGAVIMQCPIEAAKRIAQKGRLQVGWVSTHFKVLDPRPVRCFRCLEIGHRAAVCQSKTDRSGLCFRCGEAGHRANACGAEVPSCAVCAAAGRPAGHKLGGAACAVPSSRTRGGKKKKKAGDGPRAPSLPSCPSASAGGTAVAEEPMALDGPVEGAQEVCVQEGPLMADRQEGETARQGSGDPRRA